MRGADMRWESKYNVYKEKGKSSQSAATFILKIKKDAH